MLKIVKYEDGVCSFVDDIEEVFKRQYRDVCIQKYPSSIGEDDVVLVTFTDRENREFGVYFETLSFAFEWLHEYRYRIQINS